MHRVLRGIDASLPERVADVIDGRSEPGLGESAGLQPAGCRPHGLLVA